MITNPATDVFSPHIMQLPTNDGVLDLWACARAPEEITTLSHLLRDTAPPDDRNDYGETALHVAAAHGNNEAVILLLQYGADLMAADWESGWTPLHRSLYYQHLSTSLLLLRHAQMRYDRNFVRKYLYEIRDHSQQSPMQLLSSILQRDGLHVPNTVNSHAGGVVYTFGKRDYQLGYHLPNADMQVTPRLVELPASSPIIQLSASKYHTIALNAAGECFVWGFGKGGRLGTGNEFDRVEPTRLASLESTFIKKVAAGENHTMALSQTGQVYSWGSNSFGQLGHSKSSSLQSRLTPKRVDTLRFHVVAEIAASGCHSAAIDAEDGAVYTWGSNRRGQLGRKEGCGTDQADATPRSVDALCLRHSMCAVYGNYDSIRAEKVALSDWHTCVVLRCVHNGRSLGQVWQFGYGSYRPNRVNISSAVARSVDGAVMCDTWIPTCKQRGIDIVQVSCAQNHSIALSACGSVFTWGHNGPALSHKLSSSSRDHRTYSEKTHTSSLPSPSAPQEVLLAPYGPVASVCASQDHCAVVTQQGDLVTWGCGQQGVLGHGRGNTWQPNPKRVAGVKKAVAVAAGHQHTAVLVAPVHPEFDAVSDVTTCSQGEVPSLLKLVERKIVTFVNISNCALVWQYAERYASFRLLHYCIEYMRSNWDAVLDVGGRDRLEMLYDVMLPSLQNPKSDRKDLSADFVGKPSKERRTAKQSFATKSAICNGPASPVAVIRKDSHAINKEMLTMASLESASSQSFITVKKTNGRRKSRTSKFVPLESFSTSKITVVPKRRDASSPWGLTAIPTPFQSQTIPSNTEDLPAVPAFLEAFPLPVSSLCKTSRDGTISRQRKASIGSYSSASPRPSFSPPRIPEKHMLCYDGAEYKRETKFSLDAFLKKSVLQRNRGTSSVPAAITWSSHVTDSMTGIKSRPKTLKEIQEEEEAAAAHEREAKARLGGTFAPLQRSLSTINSWGLCQNQAHVSLADVQKLQEEHEFLEQQYHILADIEREQSAKARLIAAAAVGDTILSGVKDSKKVLRGSRRRLKTTDAGAEEGNFAASASRTNLSGDGKIKQNKQKKAEKAKTRKAARKAAGETFAENTKAGTIKKKSSAQRG